MTATSFRPGQRFDTEDNRWVAAKEFMGTQRVALGPVASHSWLHQPEHLAFQLSRYRAAAALIGNAETVIELGAGEGIGAGILAKGRTYYCGVDNDGEAVMIARQTYAERPAVAFAELDVVDGRWMPGTLYDAVVSLDVIEHIPAERERAFIENAGALIPDHGVLVIGTPSKNAEHLASPQSKAGHINTYTPERLRALMQRYFYVVQMAYMQDTAIHFGHPEMAHYVLAVGIGVRT